MSNKAMSSKEKRPMPEASGFGRATCADLG
jgi:hypothetical protein